MWFSLPWKTEVSTTCWAGFPTVPRAALAAPSFLPLSKQAIPSSRRHAVPTNLQGSSNIGGSCSSHRPRRYGCGCGPCRTPDGSETFRTHRRSRQQCGFANGSPIERTTDEGFAPSFETTFGCLECEPGSYSHPARAGGRHGGAVFIRGRQGRGKSRARFVSGRQVRCGRLQPLVLCFVFVSPVTTAKRFSSIVPHWLTALRTYGRTC